MKTLKFLAIPLMLSLFFVLISAKAGDKENERVQSASNVLKDFSKMKDEKKEKETISIQLAAAAQAAYAEDAKRESGQQGQPAQMGLNPGWGGKGR